MPVHNALPHLDEAIESIIGQTYADFEFVILDDASTDGSTERLREWAAREPRIRLVEVKTNLGPALSSQRVAEEARAPIVARTDADDICYPTRLAEQMELMEAHPDVGVVGGLYDIIDATGRKIRAAEPWRLVRRSPFPPFGNGPLMYRRAVFDRVGGYRGECRFWEDYDLILRLARITKILVIPHAIYKVRQSTSGTRFASGREALEPALDLMYRSCERLKRGESYDDLLEAHSRHEAKLNPIVFIWTGSVVLWAGGKPKLFRRLLSRARLSPDFQTAKALVWTAWASRSPSTLRRLMLSLIKLRNRVPWHRISTSTPLLWQPFERAKAPQPRARTQPQPQPKLAGRA